MSSLFALRTLNRLLGAVAPDVVARHARRLLMRPHPRPPRGWEEAALRSAERITFRFGLSGLRWGDRGPITLLMHGWEGRPTQFAAFIAPLLAQGRQVIALDAPAHGRSPGREAHPLAFAEALLEAASELREIDAAIGHSMGGSALLLAMERGLSVRKAVTIGAPAAMPRVLDRFARFIGLPATAHRRFRRLVDRYTGVRAEQLDVRHGDAPLDVPGLIVHDTDDTAVPFDEALALREAWPGARLIATQGFGHRQVLASPKVIAEIATFFAEGREQPRLAA